MRATEELKQEHRVIEKVLRSLFAASTRLQRGEEINPQFFREAIDFIRNFADKCHHGKEEDNLFLAIERQGFPRDGGPTGTMRAEHDEGRAHVRELASALDSYERGDRSREVTARIAAHAMGYVRLLAQHIEKEDNILYVIADDVIPPAEQAQLLQAFADVEQRSVGETGHSEYVKLADRLEEAMQAQGARL